MQNAILLSTTQEGFTVIKKSPARDGVFPEDHGWRLTRPIKYGLLKLCASWYTHGDSDSSMSAMLIAMSLTSTCAHHTT